MRNISVANIHVQASADQASACPQKTTETPVRGRSIIFTCHSIFALFLHIIHGIIMYDHQNVLVGRMQFHSTAWEKMAMGDHNTLDALEPHKAFDSIC